MPYFLNESYLKIITIKFKKFECNSKLIIETNRKLKLKYLENKN